MSDNSQEGPPVEQARRLVHLRASLKHDALPEHVARLKRIEADRG